MSNRVGELNASGRAIVQVGDTYNQTKDTCLADLLSTDPSGDKERIKVTKGGFFQDACRWILNHADFQLWRDNRESRLLWIKGDPGKGKTMLLIGIIEEL